MSRRSSTVRSQLFGDFTEADLIKLQQQHRKAEGAKQAYTRKTQALIYRDEREIQRLKDEREELLRSLRVSHNSSHCREDTVVQELTSMLACRDKIDKELQAEKDKVASLKDQISKWERKLAGQRTGEGTACRGMKSDNNVIKNIRSIENKLHMGRKCFNKLMTRNGELREELKTLQMDKKHFLHVQSRLEKELHAVRKDIANLTTKCTEAFNTSVKFHEKQRMQWDQNAKDVAQYFKDRSNLEREISHHHNFEAFLDTKAITRSTQDTDRQVEKHKQFDSKELGPEDFEDAIKKILSETEESDPDKLVKNFLQMEEQNYTLLNFVNIQHNEAECIRRQISELRSGRKIFADEEMQQQEQHHALLMRVSIEREATEQQLAVYQHRGETMEKLLDLLKEGVKSLLQISYDNSMIWDQLCSSDGVQDENIEEYLIMVEDRVNELLTLQSFLHFQENVSQWDRQSQYHCWAFPGNNPHSDVNVTTAAMPVLDDDRDLVDLVLLEAKDPASREDLLTLVNKGIQRKKKTG